jgi:enamine deaminase RidA (YjgF/YER057c/UK114 family)
MAISTWADVDPRACRITVYYEGTNTIYEGMLVHYNHDTTTNWSSVDRSATTGGTYDTDTPEGSQNEGKWIRVEDPSNANRRFPAGVVAKGSKGIGSAGPSEIDIYVLNGATVPVYTDRSVTINDPAHMEVGQNTVVNLDLGGEQIGHFMETIDRSSTAGLALACLQPPDMSQIAATSTLGVGLSPLLWGDAPKNTGDPGLGVQYFNDFMDEVDVTTGDGWTLTQVDTKGSITVEAVAAGGVLQVTSATGDSADDGINAQLKNCAVLPAAGVNIWFEARIKCSDATQQWFAGLAAVDTTLIAAGVLDDVVDKVGFYHEAASTDNKMSSVTARTSADDKTTDVAANVDDTWTTIGFRITGLTSVEFYVNGVLVETGSTAANIPNAGMCLSFVSQYESADNILSVDWVKIVTSGGRDA